MDNTINYIRDFLLNDNFEKCIISSPRLKSNEVKSITLVKVGDLSEVKMELRLEKHNDIKTITKANFNDDLLAGFFKEFKQILLRSSLKETHILINKKLLGHIKEKKLTETTINKKHNRSKGYLLIIFT